MTKFGQIRRRGARTVRGGRHVLAVNLLTTAILGASTALLHAAPVHAQDIAWQSGFENGFPGEWDRYNNGTYSADGSVPAGQVAAWTITRSDQGVVSPSGGAFYKGWIVGPAPESHRPYPLVSLDIRTPLVNTFWVYLDTDYSTMSSTDWIHFGTWGHTVDWKVFTMSVRDRKLEFAHTDPSSGQYIGPLPRPDFPLRRWVRFSMYMLFNGNEGMAQVWQDGVPMLRAALPMLASDPATNLIRAHWGMYAAGSVSKAVQYNDDIRICSLAAPLVDLTSEPVCGPLPATQLPKPPGDLKVM